MSLQKNALCRGDARSDARCYALQQFRESGLEVLLRSLYPSLMALHQMDASVALPPLAHTQSCTYAENPAALPESVRVTGERALILPPLLNLSLAALTADGVYLLDDGFTLWLLLGSQVDPAVMNDLFGVASLEGYDVPNMRLPLLETTLSQKVHLLVQELRTDRPYFCPLKIVRVTDPEFAVLKWRLVEDRDVFPGGNYSYLEYVQLVTGSNPSY